MMKSLALPGLALMLALLAGCGVDGPPTRPETTRPDNTAPPGVEVSGEARFGVVSGL